ncbi:MAG: PepSY domain-containing protein [Geminicoccaceae bacterium]
MKVLVPILFLVIGIAAVQDVHAADDFSVRSLAPLGIAPSGSNIAADEVRPTGEPKPLESVLQAIQRRLPGRALGARMVDHRGRQAYEIRWMGENGKVSDITADAMSGEIVEKR